MIQLITRATHAAREFETARTAFRATDVAAEMRSAKKELKTIFIQFIQKSGLKTPCQELGLIAHWCCRSVAPAFEEGRVSKLTGKFNEWLYKDCGQIPHRSIPISQDECTEIIKSSQGFISSYQRASSTSLFQQEHATKRTFKNAVQQIIVSRAITEEALCARLGAADLTEISTDRVRSWFKKYEKF